ncbi:MAG: MlaD family protein [Enhygromyxa sp.]
MATLGRQALKVGAFVATVAVLLALALLVMGGLAFWRPVDNYYVITDEAVAGINVKSTVTMRGVAVGKVESILLDRESFDRVTIGLEIDPDVRIPAGSQVYFERVGLTGERAVNISGGTLADGEIPPGSTLPRGETELERLQERVSELGRDLDTLIAEATATVEQIEAIVAAVDPERVAAIIEAVDPERVESIVLQAERSAKTLVATGRQLGRAVTETRADIERVADSAAENLDGVAATVDEVATKAGDALERVDGAAKAFQDMSAGAESLLIANEHELRATIRNLRQATQDAAALMQELRERPNLLLRSRSRRERRERRERQQR